MSSQDYYYIMFKQYARKSPLDKKNQKYNNRKITKHLTIKRLIDGEFTYEEADWKFDSGLEYEHFLEFLDMEKAGELEHYIFKPERLLLCPSYKEVKIRPAYYHPDHLLVYKDGTKKYVDSKGFETDIFKLKQKIVYDRHKILVEVKNVKTNYRGR